MSSSTSTTTSRPAPRWTRWPWHSGAVSTPDYCAFENALAVPTPKRDSWRSTDQFWDGWVELFPKKSEMFSVGSNSGVRGCSAACCSVSPGSAPLSFASAPLVVTTGDIEAVDAQSDGCGD